MILRWEGQKKTGHNLCSLQQKCRSPTTSETKFPCWWCWSSNGPLHFHFAQRAITKHIFWHLCSPGATIYVQRLNFYRWYCSTLRTNVLNSHSLSKVAVFLPKTLRFTWCYECLNAVHCNQSWCVAGSAMQRHRWSRGSFGHCEGVGFWRNLPNLLNSDWRGCCCSGWWVSRSLGDST